MEFLTNGVIWAVLGAALAVLLAGIGSARGVGMVGEAAAALATEEPEKFGKTILLQALPGTQGIYGLIVAFMILLKVGLIGGGSPDVSFADGMILFFSAMPIAFGGFFSALYQARVATRGISLIAKRPEELSKGIVYAAIVETYAVLSLLVSLLIIFGLTI